MSEILITPKQAQKAISEADAAREKRDRSIVAMRKENPRIWTYDKLAEYWGLTKQRIGIILERYGVE